MLQLILGIAGTGKTTWILEELQARALRKRPSVLLVPEQFSSSAETLVLETLGDASSAYVEVLSFRTLANRLLQGVDEHLHILSDAGRAVFVKRALKLVQNNLQNFGRNKQDTAFCNLCAQTLTELKTAGATAESLSLIGLQTGEKKFSDLAHLLAAYEAVLSGSAVDPDDRLLLACEKADPAWFLEKSCFIDNFDGFTAPEYALLACLMQHSEALYVSLCCDRLQETDGGLGLFSPPRSTAQRLLQQARRLGLSTPAPLTFEQARRSTSSELLSANLCLAGETPLVVQQEGSLTFTQADDRYAEVKLAAAEMYRLAKQGVSFSKMALLCRDVSLYESIVRREMALFSIPWHSDTPDNIEFTAPFSFLRSALKLLQRNLSSELILTLLKTDLCGFSSKDLSALENYIFTWQPTSAQWRVPFSQNPNGLLQKMDEQAEQALQAAESVRSAVLPQLESFLQEAKGESARNLSLQLYRLMEHFEAPLHHAEKAASMEEMGDYALAERSRRAWDLCMDFLDQMANLLEGEAVSAAEYEELLLLLVRSTDFGQIPKTLESVPFVGADRARLAEPDHCFVLGLHEGEFPAKVGYSGLLSHSDRDLLVEHKIEMPGSFQNRILLEQMFLYRSLTAARKSLHLSYPLHVGGVLTRPSAQISQLQTHLQAPPLHINEEDLAPTVQAAFDRLAVICRENTQENVDLQAALAGLDGNYMNAQLSLLQEVNVPEHFFVQDSNTLRSLCGDLPRLSPTKIERYFRCRFSYLMEHVLHIRARRKAEFSVLESGNLVHYVLEQVLKEQGKDFSACSDESLQRLTRKHLSEFADANFPEITLRLQSLLQRIQENVFSLLQYLRNWAQNSKFETQALELGIGGKEVQALCLESEHGAKIEVYGKVDRVDLLKKNGKTYICILDYKTGNQSFDLDEVLYGLNLQMLVYMDVLCRQTKGPYHKAIPAGLLYLSADPSPKSGTRQETEKNCFRLDGLLLDDAEVLEALDKDKSGLFLPLRYKKDGSPSGSQLASLQRIGGLALHVESLMEEMADGLLGGDFSARPLVKSGGVRPCQYCPYFASCRHEYGKNEVAIVRQTELLEKIEQKEAGFYHE